MQRTRPRLYDALISSRNRDVQCCFQSSILRFTSKSPAKVGIASTRAKCPPALVSLLSVNPEIRRRLSTPESERLVSCENGAIRPAQSIVASGQIIIGFACITVPVDERQCFVVVISILPIIYTLVRTHCHCLTFASQLTRHTYQNCYTGSDKGHVISKINKASKLKSQQRDFSKQSFGYDYHYHTLNVATTFKEKTDGQPGRRSLDASPAR